ncbi:hypothetical protein E0485_18890 [Paenibacillus albiflavus]|uniref:Uncharacterized protein n=1 Tax=Paenibacillus albiflavus TaxID=2545760 RepID=A0A4R4E7H3_9BACL|nr:hypothetical protein [Paenibacillus albiflavus]TCZ75057.1 hypothetical protein E0485_18890 [Paenibacillus albiflavus]
MKKLTKELLTDEDYRTVKQETLPNGIFISTIRLGLDTSWSRQKCHYAPAAGKAHSKKPKLIRWTMETLRSWYENLRRWFENLSGATKFILVLCILFTVTNITLSVSLSQKLNEALNTINSSSLFSAEKREALSMVGLTHLLDEAKNAITRLMSIGFTLIGFYLSYFIGKFFGFFKSLVEMLGDIKDDGWGYFFVLIYNGLSIIFDIQTLFSLITV